MLKAGLAPAFFFLFVDAFQKARQPTPAGAHTPPNARAAPRNAEVLSNF